MKIDKNYMGFFCIQALRKFFFNSGDWFMFLFKLMFYFLIQFDAMWCPHNTEHKYKRDVVSFPPEVIKR